MSKNTNSTTARYYIKDDMVWDRDGTDTAVGNALFRPGNARHDFLLDALNSHASQSARIAELERALSIITLNATVQPDARMSGMTDCYAVPLDDIESARALLGKGG